METIILQWNPNQKWPDRANTDVALMHLEPLARFLHLHQQTKKQILDMLNFNRMRIPDSLPDCHLWSSKQTNVRNQNRK